MVSRKLSYLGTWSLPGSSSTCRPRRSRFRLATSGMKSCVFKRILKLSYSFHIRFVNIAKKEEGTFFVAVEGVASAHISLAPFHTDGCCKKRRLWRCAQRTWTKLLLLRFSFHHSYTSNIQELR